MNGEMSSIVEISSNAVRDLTSDIKKRLKKSNPGVEHIKVDVTKDSYFFRAKIEMQENMFHFICEKKHALWEKALLKAYKTVIQKMRKQQDIKQQRRTKNRKKPRLDFHFHESINPA